MELEGEKWGPLASRIQLNKKSRKLKNDLKNGKDCSV